MSDDLFHRALAVRERAYAPYSAYKVGAAIRSNAATRAIRLRFDKRLGLEAQPSRAGRGGRSEEATERRL